VKQTNRSACYGISRYIEMRRMTSDHWHLPYSKDLPAHFWRQVELGLLAHESHDLLLEVGDLVLLLAQRACILHRLVLSWLLSF